MCGTLARMAGDDARAKDHFESQYMQTSGAERRRERTVWKWHWVILAPALWTFAGMVLTLMGTLPGASLAVGAFLGVLTAFFALLWAAFLVLRVVVTDRELHVQYGLWGPKIDLAAITECKVIDYDWSRFGGWGIKRDGDGTWAYTLMGESRRVVEVTWQEGGQIKRAVVSSRTPDELVAAIEQARRERAPGAATSTGVRVGASTPDAAVYEEVTQPRDASAATKREGS